MISSRFLKSIVVGPQRRGISSSLLTIERTTDSSRFAQRPAREKLQFGLTMTDHMLMIDWKKGEWGAPRIVPYQDLKISPAASCLHYGKERVIRFVLASLAS